MDKTSTTTTTTNTNSSVTSRPAWWNDQHNSAWDRVKEAMRRDWEQTRADFGGGRDLNQNVVDTVLQAVGSEPLPAPSVKTRPDDPKQAASNLEHDIKERGKAEAKMAEARADMEAERVKADAKVAQERMEAQQDVAKQAQKVAEARAEAHRKIADEQRDAEARIAKAQREAQEKIAGQQDKLSEVRADSEQKVAETRGKALEDLSKQQDKIAEATRDWNRAEAAIQYGYGARLQYASRQWDPQLEDQLRREWGDLRNGVSWDDSRAQIRQGWDYAAKARTV